MAKSNKTKSHNYKKNPNTCHNSGRTLLVGENHHPELDLLTFGEGPEDSSPDPSTSAECSTSTDNTTAPSSSPSETGRKYAQSDPPPETTTDSPVEEERGETCHEICFLGLISCFHNLIFSYWTYYSDFFPMNYLSYSYFLANFTPRKGTKNNQGWD